MLKYSRAIMYVWQIAMSEAASAKTQFVEKEQMLIGLLRALDILEESEKEHEDLKIFKEDFKPLHEILSALNIDQGEIAPQDKGSC